MATIYLAGPIDKVTAEHASSWRDEASGILAEEHNHLVCDPNGTWRTQVASRGSHPVVECASIFRVDTACVKTADALLVWCDKNTLACGTYVETGLALSQNKIIAFYSPGVFPGFIKGACGANPETTAMFTDLTDACEWICNKVEQEVQ